MITVSSRSTLLALAAAALLPSAPALAQTPTPTPSTTPSPTATPSPSTTPSPTPVGSTRDADRTVIDAGQTVSVAVYGQVGALVGLYGTAGGRPARLIRSGTLARSEGGDVGIVVFSGLQPGETTTFSADVGLRDSPSVRTGPLTVRVRRTVTIGIRQDVQGIYTFTGQVARAEPGLQVTIARLASGTNEVTGVASTTTDAAGRYALRTPLPPGMSGYYALTGVNRSSLDPGRSRLYGLLVEPVAAPAHAVAPRSGAQPVPRPADVDCRDFRTQRAAQAFYDRYVGRFGDFARLDGDDDGRACEALP